MKQLIDAIRGAECPMKQSDATNRGAIKLRNIITGEESVDVAHNKAANPVKCTSDVCSGSVQSFLNIPTNEPRDAKQILKEAHDFLTEYYESKKSYDVTDFKQRMNEIIKDVVSKGTYNLTEDELTYGAKLAWRNAPRCIGRVYWNSLKVFDARHVKTAKEMFDALCEHMKYATNGGKLRSAITVFPQRKPGQAGDFKVWNPQLVSFAGYADPNDADKIIGDPARLEFTQLCESLGWKGQKTNFDVLPWILSANGGDPQLFEIPEELILLVRLRHPKYSWFEDLNLSWNALPAVSNMLFDIGGIQFPAAPFNGWFMATEIACRDLCDRNRYNMLETVATKMGLDTRSNSTLWKDFALLEIHVAVVDSYQKQGVTIVDHHTASESFIRHFESEKRLRGGCPADWAWIVPPTSSGITPVFHQEMLCYKLKPSFEYQENAWKTHQWQNPLQITKRKLVFKIFAKAVLFASKLYSKALSKRSKVTIIYATETGKSEEYANRLCRLFKSAFNVQVHCMDSYDIKHLNEEKLLLVVTSTFGSGEAPENGDCFARQLESMVKRSTSKCAFKYAVFALGSSNYPTFCAFGKHVDTLLSNVGDRILNVATGDEICGEEQSFIEWSQNVFRHGCDLFAINFGDQQPMRIEPKEWSRKSVKIVPLLRSTPFDVSSGLQSLVKGANRKIAPFKLKYRRDFFKCNSFDRRTIFVQLEFQANEDEDAESKDGLQIDYLPGDHLAVCPENNKVIVDALLQRLDVVHADDPIEIFVQKDSEFVPCEKLPPTTIREAFTRYLDITSPPTQQLLSFLAQYSSVNEQTETMNRLAIDNEYYEQWKAANVATLVDVLYEFSSVEPPLELMLTELPSLKPRFYSISSSPLYNTRQKQMSNKALSESEKESKESRKEKMEKYSDKFCERSSLVEPKTTIDLTVSVVSYKTPNGSENKGVCSNFLASAPLGHTMYGYIRSAPNFKLPDDPSVPIIMVGPGTGIAPLRSFWLRRCARMKLCPNETTNFGKLSLFFGCQTPDMRLYSDEIEKMKEKGVLNAVYNAYSRDSNQPKKYVQDLINDNCSDVFSELFEQEGHIYVCGDVTMATDVYATLRRILNERGIADSEATLSRMKKELRYHEDIYGVRHRPSIHEIRS